jgi:NAD-dependent deacetylase
MANFPELQRVIDTSNRVVFFGGAGVSTESGIPDFRSQEGLFSQKTAFPPETILSHSFFFSHTEEFYKYYLDKFLHPTAKPNAAHIALAKMEKTGKLLAVITQNVDGLHQAAGSHNVFELHGSVHRNYCLNCGLIFPLEAMLKAKGIPKCLCGGTIKPYVVLYEEPLSQEIISAAVNSIQTADTLIIGGTSLNVYPAAGLIQYYTGDMLVLINKTETPYDKHAKIVIRDSIGEALAATVDLSH